MIAPQSGQGGASCWYRLVTLLMVATGAPPRGVMGGDRNDFFLVNFFHRFLLDDAGFLLRIAVEKLAGEPAENVIHDRLWPSEYRDSW